MCLALTKKAGIEYLTFIPNHCNRNICYLFDYGRLYRKVSIIQRYIIMKAKDRDGTFLFFYQPDPTGTF